jgi:hypothetical protein
MQQGNLSQVPASGYNRLISLKLRGATVAATAKLLVDARGQAVLLPEEFFEADEGRCAGRAEPAHLRRVIRSVAGGISRCPTGKTRMSVLHKLPVVSV